MRTGTASLKGRLGGVSIFSPDQSKF